MENGHPWYGYSRKILYLMIIKLLHVSHMRHIHLEFQTRYELIEGERNTDVWLTCYITMTCNHHASSLVLQHTMRELKGCGVMFLGVFYNLLYGLEDDEFLDPLNDTDLFLCSFAILPQVNRCLEGFTEG